MLYYIIYLAQVYKDTVQLEELNLTALYGTTDPAKRTRTDA